MKCIFRIKLNILFFRDTSDKEGKCQWIISEIKNSILT